MQLTRLVLWGARMSRLEPTNGLGIVEVSAPRRANWVNRQAFPGSPYTELSTGILRLGEAGTAGEGTHLLRGGFIIAPAGGDVIVCPSAHPGAFFVAERAVARRGARPSNFISLVCPLLRSLMSHSSAPLRRSPTAHPSDPLRRSPTAHVSLFRPRFAYPQNPRKMATSAING